MMPYPQMPGYAAMPMHAMYAHPHAQMPPLPHQGGGRTAGGAAASGPGSRPAFSGNAGSGSGSHRTSNADGSGVDAPGAATQFVAHPAHMPMPPGMMTHGGYYVAYDRSGDPWGQAGGAYAMSPHAGTGGGSGSGEGGSSASGAGASGEGRGAARGVHAGSGSYGATGFGDGSSGSGGRGGPDSGMGLLSQSGGRGGMGGDGSGSGAARGANGETIVYTTMPVNPFSMPHMGMPSLYPAAAGGFAVAAHAHQQHQHAYAAHARGPVPSGRTPGDNVDSVSDLLQRSSLN